MISKVTEVTVGDLTDVAPQWYIVDFMLLPFKYNLSGNSAKPKDLWRLGLGHCTYFNALFDGAPSSRSSYLRMPRISPNKRH